MTEKLLTGTLSLNTKKKKKTLLLAYGIDRFSHDVAHLFCKQDFYLLLCLDDTGFDSV